MKIVYTDTFELTGAWITIEKGDTSGGGVIPKDVIANRIWLQVADQDSDQISIKGFHPDSNWANMPVGEGWALTENASEHTQFVYVKSASGTITVTLVVEGAFK